MSGSSRSGRDAAPIPIVKEAAPIERLSVHGFDLATQPFRFAIGQTPTMAPYERPSTFLARVRSQLDAFRAAILSYLGQKPRSSEGGTGGAVG